MNDKQFKRMTEQERKHVERLIFKFRAWEFWRILRGVALGIFLIWLGLTAIDRGESYILALYVVIASAAVASENSIHLTRGHRRIRTRYRGRR